MADDDTFTELDADMTVMTFWVSNYENKTEKRARDPKRGSRYLRTAKVMGEDCAVFCMDPHFMMGNMGTVVGERSRVCLSTPQSTVCLLSALRRQAAPGCRRAFCL